MLLCGLPRQNYESNLSLRKIPDKPKQKDSLQNISPVILETLKVIQNMESLGSCHSLEKERRHDD